MAEDERDRRVLQVILGLPDAYWPADAEGAEEALSPRLRRQIARASPAQLRAMLLAVVVRLQAHVEANASHDAKR